MIYLVCFRFLSLQTVYRFYQELYLQALLALVIVYHKQKKITAFKLLLNKSIFLNLCLLQNYSVNILFIEFFGLKTIILT